MSDTYTPPSFATQTDLNAVAARVGTLEGKVAQHESLLGSILETLKRNSQMAQDNNTLLHTVLNVVRGQREPGLERPGLADDIKTLSSKIVAIEVLYADLKSADTSRKGWLAGVVTIVTLASGFIATYFYEDFHNLMSFIEHLAPSKP